LRRSKELKALELEWNTIDKGKVQYKAARRKLCKLKDKGLGRFLKKNSGEIALWGKRRLLGTCFKTKMITSPIPVVDVL